MSPLFIGRLTAEKKRFALIVSQFNQMITQRLQEGALDCLRHHGVRTDTDVDIYHCPGAFELSQVAAKITAERKYDAVICLGAVIKGETPHFTFISQECAYGIGAVARERRIPVMFGVLTTDTYEQAVERSGGSMGNKGYDAALGALSMADLFSQIHQ
jgi:6,7-dimethyl-8-ribityllumazine synthase